MKPMMTTWVAQSLTTSRRMPESYAVPLGQAHAGEHADGDQHAERLQPDLRCPGW